MILARAAAGKNIKSAAGNNSPITFMFWKKKKNDNGGGKEEQKMGMLQRLAMKKLEKMDPKERERLAHKALSPENIEKNKDKILATMEQMKTSGQLTEEQINLAKEKLGL
jgi:hypothetical protein